MEYIAKKRDEIISPPISTTNSYEIKVVEEAEGVDGNKVDILRSIGFYNITHLEEQKQQLLKQIAEIEAKIAAINLVKPVIKEL